MPSSPHRFIVPEYRFATVIEGYLKVERQHVLGWNSASACQKDTMDVVNVAEWSGVDF